MGHSNMGSAIERVAQIINQHEQLRSGNANRNLNDRQRHMKFLKAHVKNLSADADMMGGAMTTPQKRQYEHW